MTNVPSITVYTGTVPIKAVQDPIEFSNNVGDYLDYFDAGFTPDTNAMIPAMNELANEMTNLGVSVEGFANYKGDYASTTIYSQGESISYADGYQYTCKLDNTLDLQPDLYPARWMRVEKGLAEVKYDTSPELGGDLDGLGETIYNTTIGTTTGLALNLSSGNILKATLTTDNSISFTNIPSGSIDWLAEITSGGFTITWDGAVEWDGDGTEPKWSLGTDTAYFYTTDGGTTIKGMRVRAGA